MTDISDIVYNNYQVHTFHKYPVEYPDGIYADIEYDLQNDYILPRVVCYYTIINNGSKWSSQYYFPELDKIAVSEFTNKNAIKIYSGTKMYFYICPLSQNEINEKKR